MSIDLGSISIKHALDNIQFSPSAGVVTPSPSNKALAPWQERESILSESSSDETTVLHLAPFLDKQQEKDTGSSRSTANGGGPGSAAAPAKPMNSRQRRTERRKRERENKARLDAGLPPLPELGR